MIIMVFAASLTRLTKKNHASKTYARPSCHHFYRAHKRLYSLYSAAVLQMISIWFRVYAYEQWNISKPIPRFYKDKTVQPSLYVPGSYSGSYVRILFLCCLDEVRSRQDMASIK